MGLDRVLLFHFELPNANAPGRRVLEDGTILGGPPGETPLEEELTAMARYQGVLMGRFIEASGSPTEYAPLTAAAIADWANAEIGAEPAAVTKRSMGQGTARSEKVSAWAQDPAGLGEELIEVGVVV